MFTQLDDSGRHLAIQRLTALWALNECGLGGVLHALNSPFTGLLVGSFAMICIALICAFAESKWKAVMTSLMIVLVIKALVSPHSTPTAYIAVIFQGVTGALIYRFIPYLLLSSLFFLTLGLLESAMQRLLTMTILYGNALWEAIDIWGEWVAQRWSVIIPVSSSRLLITLYLSVHLIAGLVFGWMVYRIILAVKAMIGDPQFQLTLQPEHRKEFFGSGKPKRKKWKRYVLFFALILIILFAYSGLGNPSSNMQKGLISVVRAFSILTVWFVFLAPWMIRLLQKFLSRKHRQLSAEVSQTMDMFPHLLWIIDKSWKESSSLSWVARWKAFMIRTLLYILQYKPAYDPDPGGTDPKL